MLQYTASDCFTLAFLFATFAQDTVVEHTFRSWHIVRTILQQRLAKAHQAHQQAADKAAAIIDVPEGALEGSEAEEEEETDDLVNVVRLLESEPKLQAKLASFIKENP
jgi:hypothetical protein